MRSLIHLAAAFAAAFAAVIVASPAHAQPLPQPPFVESFDVPGEGPPPGWFVPTGGNVSVVEGGADDSAGCLRLVNGGAGQSGVVNCMRNLDATPYRGRRIRLSIQMRVDFGAVGGAQAWLRVDRVGGQPGFIGGTGDRPVTSTTWETAAVVADVDDDAASFALGCLAARPMTAFFDEIVIEDLGAAGAGATAAAPLEGRALENAIAFARAVGYVRHFHPSDEAQTLDWERFIAGAMLAAEQAKDAPALAAVLTEAFAPIAATVEFTTIEPDAAPLAAPDAAPDGADGHTHWVHDGYGQKRAGMNIYKSNRARLGLGNAGAVAPGEVVAIDLGAGVWCRLPIDLYTKDGATLPASSAAWKNPLDPAWAPFVADRQTRLAAIVIGWNVFQHFYPYFDVVDVDWNAVLRSSLERAATDEDDVAFARTLQLLVGALHDGHGRVSGRSMGAAYRIPVVADFIDGALVVTRAFGGGGPVPVPGETIVSIDGEPVADLWADLEPRLSGATMQWKRSRGRSELLMRRTPGPVPLELLRPDGSTYSMIVEAVAGSLDHVEQRPEQIAEIEPGIWYVDLGRIDDASFNAALDDLAQATGIVFDMRGYPGKLSAIVLAHLTDEAVRSAKWNIPRIHRPDRVDMTFSESGWPVMPASPRLTAKVAFITDGRAISYAETYMGIVEAFDLGTTVGEATAGTNGNVNPIALPGGYTLSWTGMKVLKHDGSVHHGVGIEPDVPVKRTVDGVASGKDEFLEAALEVVR